MSGISSQLAFLSGAPGHLEILLLFVLILILFGPRKLPDIARMIGRTISDLRSASQDFRDQVMSIDQEDDEGVCEEPAEQEPVEQEPDKKKPDEPQA